MHTDHDPRAIVSLPPTGPVELLFLLFHGVDGQAASMRPLGDALREQYPQAAVVSLAAPPEGWFPVVGINADNQAERVRDALPALVERIRAWADHFEMTWERVALAGFSQGATLALEAVQFEPRLAGRVLALCGGYALPPQHAPQEVSIHLLHGMADPLVPYPPVVDTARALVLLGADVTADILPAVGHELHPAVIAKALAQLRTFIPGRLWREAVLAAPKD